MVMELLRQGARELGLILGDRHLEAFERYYRELSCWNERFNLTTVTRYEDVQIKHFLDSLSCLLALGGGGNHRIPDTVPLQTESRPLWCLDVGSGAGFPGIPLKIMLPEIKLTLVEATGKKARFLQHMVQVLHLDRVQVLNARVEDVGHMPGHREEYDIVVARAVAHLRVLSEYCLPLCRVGGRMVAPKGEDAQQETSEARVALETLGGGQTEVKPVDLSGLQPGRYLVVVQKEARSPEHLPRRAGIPAKRPLC